VEQMHAVLFEDKSLRLAVDEMLARAARDELTGAVL